jgi:hypothetical protein
VSEYELVLENIFLILNIISIENGYLMDVLKKFTSNSINKFLIISSKYALNKSEYISSVQRINYYLCFIFIKVSKLNDLITNSIDNDYKSLLLNNNDLKEVSYLH